MFDSVRLDALGQCDSLYLSPHPEDAAVSCPGGIYEESRRGLRVLVVTLFGDEPTAVPRERRPTAILGGDQAYLGLPEASLRHPAYGTFHTTLGERHSDDEACLDGLERLLAELARRTKPRHVYIPLGVWGHVDHRLTSDAAQRVFEAGAGRDVFFYEERPFGLLPGSVRVRLAQIGARLPPGAAGFGDRASLLRFVLGFQTDPYVRRHFKGFWDGLRCSQNAARDWRSARGWVPHKAFGPRLQPVLHASEPEALVRLEESFRDFPLGSPFGKPGRLRARLDVHARRLGQPAPLERYWLLLPPRELSSDGDLDAVALSQAS